MSVRTRWRPRAHRSRGETPPASSTSTSTSTPPSGWVRDGAGYARALPGGAVLSVRPSAGQWYWSLVFENGRTGRYGRSYRLLSACIAAADRAAESAVVSSLPSS
jgi:hypothetical protein